MVENPSEWILTKRRPRRTGRPSEVLDTIARLRECGAEGDDETLAALLEVARFDVDRAANIWLDRNGGAVQASISNDRLSHDVEDYAAFTGQDIATIDPVGVALTALRHGIESSEVRADKPSGTPVKRQSQRALPRDTVVNCIEDAKSQGASYAKMSHRKDNRQHRSLQVSLLGSEGQEQPTGVHYEMSRLCTESYDVDVVRMVQVHNESGTIRNIRREKAGTWRFEQKGNKWCPYPPEVANELERVFRGLGHLGGSWDRLDVSATSGSAAAFSSLERSLSSARLGPDELSAAREMLFLAAEAGTSSDVGRLAKLLLSFASQHGMSCDVSFARRAGLVVGSMCLLQAVFITAPMLCLIGEEVFDRKYPKLSMQCIGRKNSVRCLLARGMTLGSRSNVPTGKLLRKVEADAEPAWVRRWLDSMMVVCPQMPQIAIDRICVFVGIDP